MSYDTSGWKLAALEIDAEEAQHIGNFILYWGMVEDHLDGLFPILFRINPTLSLCLTANLGTKPKVEMLQSALNMLAPGLPKETVDKAHECLDMALEYGTKYRNLLAHGRPLAMSEKEGPPEWAWVRFAARKKLTLFLPDYSGDDWRIACGALWIIIEGLFNAKKALYPIVWSFTDDDFDRICEMTGKGN